MAQPSKPTSENSGSEVGGGAPASTRQRRTTRKMRWSVRLILGIPVFLALVVLALMRSPLVGHLATSRIGRLTGCTLESPGGGRASAYIDVDGRLVVRPFELRLPGVPGDAGLLMSAQGAVVDMDWSGLLWGDIKATGVRLAQPVFRISQSIEGSEVNLGALATRSGALSPTATPPRIDVIDGTIEYAEHDKATGTLHVLRQLRVSGSFTPTDSVQAVYSVRFSEVGAPTRALLLDGRVDLGKGSALLKLYNVALDAWTSESVPTAYRDLWRRLNVHGRISSASLDYEASHGPLVVMNFDDVAMNIPIPAEAEGPSHDLGLQNVAGSIQFSPAGLHVEVAGEIEGQSGRSTLTLETKGTELDCALTCIIGAKNIALTKETSSLPYIPEEARQYFRLFSGPTGEIDATVHLSRDAPKDGKAAPIRIAAGQVDLRHGQAAFKLFPYPLLDMSGSFEFDDDAIRIVNMRGHGASGALLRARGLITPLTEEAMVDVDVHAEQAPVDSYLLDAMPADRREVVEHVFSKQEFIRLLADGLIRRPGAAQPENPALPEFDLAGLCTVDVNVHSPKGKDAPWFTTIEIGFDSAGVLVDAFPVPVRASGVKLHVTDEDARLVEGTFTPISGGTLDVAATVDFLTAGKHQARPDVRIVAADVPIDALLLHALPRDDVEGSPTPVQADADIRDTDLSELVRRLHATGVVGCDARITADPDAPPAEGEPPTVAYDISVDLNNVKAAPALADEPPSFSIEDLSGHLRLSRSQLNIPALTGNLYQIVPQSAEPMVGPSQCASLVLTLEKHLSGDRSARRGAMDATLAVSAADLSAPLERLVGVFSPDTGRRLSDLRAERSPRGQLHTTLHVVRPPDPAVGPPPGMQVGVTLENACSIEFAALGGRVGVEWPEGVVEVVVPPEGPERLRFDTVRAKVSLDGAPCGEVQVNGSATLDAASGSVGAPADLTAQFEDWKFESPLIPPLLRVLTSETTATAYRDFGAIGPFDASLRVSTEARQGAASGAVAVRADLSPRAVAFNWNHQRIVCDEVSGRITLRTQAGAGPRPVSGLFEKLRAKTANWDAAADGAWYVPAKAPVPGGDRPVQLSLTFEIEGRKLDPALQALVPPSALKAVDALSAEFHGPFALRSGHVTTSLGDAPSPTAFDGVLEFSDASCDLGLSVQHAMGRVRIHVDDRPASHPGAGDDRTQFEVRTSIDSLRVAGVSVSNAEAIVSSGEKSGEILAPSITAHCYAGRLSGSAKVQLPAEDAGPALHPSYETELVLAGVRLAPVLADAAAAGATEPGPVGPPAPSPEPDPSRGVIDARLDISGIAGDMASRRGTGAIRISNGDIIRLPVMLPLMQFSNLQIPSKDRLAYLQADFEVRGDTATFDRISLLSRSGAIVGEGTLKWPDLTLDMKFNSRGMSRMPLVSDVLEAVRNEIVSTTVRGRLSAPIVREEPLTGTRRLIDRLLHPEAYAATPERAAPAIPGVTPLPGRSQAEP